MPKPIDLYIHQLQAGHFSFNAISNNPNFQTQVKSSSFILNNKNPIIKWIKTETKWDRRDIGKQKKELKKKKT